LTASDKRRDPYKTLGISPRVSDEELRSAYRRLVRLHHPDHNGGSQESTRRFEEIQDAYASVTEQRRRLRPRAKQAPPPPADPKLDAQIANMERELRDAYQAWEQARKAAREQARKAAGEEAAQSFKRPTDEELGYVTTDDSLSKILSDARDELSKRFSEAREHPVVKRVEDLIDELEERYRPRP
jgi:curved DNA-binding protein CbpA